MKKNIMMLTGLVILIMSFVGDVHATLMHFTFAGQAVGINEETGWRDWDEKYDFTLDFQVSLHPNNSEDESAAWDINWFSIEFDNYLIGSEFLVFEGESGAVSAFMSDTYINVNGAVFEADSDNHQLLTSNNSGELIAKPNSEIFITDILPSQYPFNGGVYQEKYNAMSHPYHSWDVLNGDILIPVSIKYLSAEAIPVPEPLSFLLLGSGLIALVGCRKSAIIH